MYASSGRCGEGSRQKGVVWFGLRVNPRTSNGGDTRQWSVWKWVTLERVGLVWATATRCSAENKQRRCTRQWLVWGGVTSEAFGLEDALLLMWRRSNGGVYVSGRYGEGSRQKFGLGHHRDALLCRNRATGIYASVIGMGRSHARSVWFGLGHQSSGEQTTAVYASVVGMGRGHVRSVWFGPQRRAALGRRSNGGVRVSCRYGEVYVCVYVY